MQRGEKEYARAARERQHLVALLPPARVTVVVVAAAAVVVSVVCNGSILAGKRLSFSLVLSLERRLGVYTAPIARILAIKSSVCVVAEAAAQDSCCGGFGSLGWIFWLLSRRRRGVSLSARASLTPQRVSTELLIFNEERSRRWLCVCVCVFG